MENIKEIQELTADLTVLYVEDDEEIAKTIVSYLSKFFKEVLYASNGEEGLELYKKTPCDLVITDIKMPKMNGLDMTFEIKQMNKNQNVVIISAYSEMENFISSIKLSIDGYIIKPINYEDMNNLLYKMAKKIKAFKNNETYVKSISELVESLHSKNTELKYYVDAVNKVAIVSKTDTKGYITFVNDIFCDVSGYTKDELIGQNHNIIRHPDMPKNVFKELWEKIQSGEIWEGNVKNKCKNGEPYYVYATIIPLLENDRKTIKEYIGIRFLTTASEMEKREFKKQVIGSYQVFRKETFTYKQRIQELETQLSALKEEDSDLVNHLSEDKAKFIHLEKQISHYESQIKEMNQHLNDVVSVYNKNAKKLGDSYKQALRVIEQYKSSNKKLEEDKLLKNGEIQKFEEKLTEQRHVISNLQDTIKHLREQVNATPKTEDSSFLKKFYNK